MNHQVNSRSNQVATGNIALAAVAFQDHMTRGLSLVDPLKKKQIHFATPKKKLKDVKSTIDTGKRKKEKVKKDEAAMDREYVIDSSKQTLSLGKIRRGFIVIVLALLMHNFSCAYVYISALTDKEWKEAKMKSNNRDDSTQPCVICKEDFGLQEQVLLSCTHVFHRACLKAFERFTGKKSCPMCRREQYQTRVIHEGSKLHRIKCVVRIQACWRGYVVRSWYKNLRKTVPPRDPKLRKKFYEEKLESIIDRLLRSYDTGVDDFLMEIDQSVAASRSIFQHLDASTLQCISNGEWELIQMKALRRGDTDCPICIMPLDSSPDESSPRLPTPSSPPEAQSKRKKVLLSCTHIFHHVCLCAFEELSFIERNVCPVCRSGYQKRVL
ncbi:RING finger protein 32-like [Anneissia japonica]|uniref:RING finger protein 32-like n=1 Tax=Anneissia japonica TaxID=1529436 RepID=UPI0014259D90|nr:RING finger protein 32-like [Anneissia japonica]